MAAAGLLSAVSPVLGAAGIGGSGGQPDTSSAAATVTNTFSTGAMSQGTSPLLWIVGGLVLYSLFKGKGGKHG